MEAPGKSCFPEGFTPLEIPVVAARNEWRDISNGVNIVSYYALASAHTGQSGAMIFLRCLRCAVRPLWSLVLNSRFRIPQSKISPCLPICSWVSPSPRPLCLCVENGLWQSSSSRFTSQFLNYLRSSTRTYLWNIPNDPMTLEFVFTICIPQSALRIGIGFYETCDCKT